MSFYIEDPAKLENRIVISQSNAASILSGSLSSNKEYFIDGIIDLSGLSVNIEVPQGGLEIKGFSFDTSKLICSDSSYTLFTSPISGSGNLLLIDLGIEITGTGSEVYDLVSDTGFEAIEIARVNFNDCTSLGTLDNYRQGLESGTGRFGGTPELTFKGTWVGGYRIDTSIARAMSNFTALFKADAGFTFDGRFAIGLNCDLPTTGAFLDFSASNITNSESLELEGCRVTRNGVINAADTTIYPNIDHTSVKSLWFGNVGLPNTTKYIKSCITTEVTTSVASSGVYYPMLGTFTVGLVSHFDMPSNGEFRLLSGNGVYQVTGHLTLDSNANNIIDLRVMLSTDNGATFPTEVDHVRRQVNSLAGGRDVAFFPVNFLADIKANARIRFEVENATAANDITCELDSCISIIKV